MTFDIGEQSKEGTYQAAENWGLGLGTNCAQVPAVPAEDVLPEAAGEVQSSTGVACPILHCSH